MLNTDFITPSIKRDNPLIKNLIQLYIEYVEAMEDWNINKRQPWDDRNEISFEGFMKYLMFEYLPDDFAWEKEE